MTDLRKAAEMALEALEWNYGTDLCDIENCMAWLDKMNATIPALRQALAQAEQKKEQEPEWIDDGFGTMWQKCGKKDCGKFVVKIGKVDCWNGDCPETTAPPKREWVGLTDEEIDKTMVEYPIDYKHEFAKAIEAKLKEKNT